jgi:purine nucleosidase
MSVKKERTVWLDADPGLDDWLAMLLLASEPGVHWEGLSVVAGNAPLLTVLDNALRICALHGWHVPVHAGATQALRGSQETAQSILGSQGMRTTGVALSATQRVASDVPAVEALLTHLRQANHLTTLLATGPLTNIAQAWQQDAAAFTQVQEIVLMGGSTDRGNHTPAAEFNIFADPEAAAIVFGSGVPLRMFGLNLCRQLLLMRAHVQAWRPYTEAGQILHGYLDAYQRIRSTDGSQPMPLYDPTVALWLIAPELFTFQTAPVDIELQGQFTRGMTVCDLRNRGQRPAQVQIAMQVDAEKAMTLFMQRLQLLE